MLSFARICLISREEALKLVESSTKRDHSIAVSGIMKELARKLGEDVEEWEIVGLLHDLDYDLTRADRGRHGITAAEILEGKLPEEALYTIKAHDHRTGLPPRSLLDRSLTATDALAVFIDDQGITCVEKGEALAARFNDESVGKPWISNAILTFCRERGFKLIELLELGLSPEPRAHTRRE